MMYEDLSTTRNIEARVNRGVNQEGTRRIASEKGGGGSRLGSKEIQNNMNNKISADVVKKSKSTDRGNSAKPKKGRKQLKWEKGKVGEHAGAQPGFERMRAGKKRGKARLGEGKGVRVVMSNVGRERCRS